jgi:6-phosphogluconolactonase
MKTQCLMFVLMIFQTHLVFADYYAYAPSRNGKSLICVKVEDSESDIKLKIEKIIDLGISAVSITKNPFKNVLYIAEARNNDQVKGSFVECDSDGQYIKHETISLDHGYCYLSLDQTNKYLFGVSYRGGQVDVYELNERGNPIKVVSSLNEGRTAAHCVLPSLDNKNIYIPYVKDNNALYQYQFDASKGKITALNPKNANPPSGTGPRHMTYHPFKNFVYFSNEQGVGVSVYRRLEDGQLKFLDAIEVVEKGRSKEGLSASDIVITQDAKFLYTGLRGQKQDFDHISRYKILEDGNVKFLGLTKTQPIPWGMCLSPNGKSLLVTSANGNQLLAYKIESNGDLNLKAALPWDAKITDIVTLD